VLLLRHSGLRIGDAVTLERSRITGGKLFLYTAKTGTPVYVPLPDFVLTDFEAVPKMKIMKIKIVDEGRAVMLNCL
jgi:integrase/recombinase XerD